MIGILAETFGFGYICKDFRFQKRRSDIRVWIEELRKSVANPEPFERFIEFVKVLDAPFEDALYDREWDHSQFRLNAAINIIFAHEDEINPFLEELLKIEKSLD